jgi:ATP-dependent Clp protease ATP-binding subunit ClpC
VIFFARYGVSQTGRMTIESEHLLLGLVQDGNILSRFVRDATQADVRDEITRRMAIKEKVPTSVDLPLSNESRRILAYAAEEAKRLNTDHIGPEHLLLGMLREETSTAAQVLYQHGLNLNIVREELARAPMPQEPTVSSTEAPRLTLLNNPALPKAGVVPETANESPKLFRYRSTGWVWSRDSNRYR